MKPRTVRLPEDLDRILQDEAEKTGTTEAEIIRQVLCDYYRIRKGENSIETLIRRVVGEVLAGSTPRAPPSTAQSTPIAPASTLIKKDMTHSRTLEAPDKHLQAEKDSTARAPENTSKDPVTAAKRFILAELKAEREPTAAEVAEAVGMDSKRLGTLLGREGIKARSVHRGGKKARRYTFDMREEIEEILAAESDESDRGTADLRR